METSTIHQADGGREEEWAESQHDVFAVLTESVEN